MQGRRSAWPGSLSPCDRAGARRALRPPAWGDARASLSPTLRFNEPAARDAIDRLGAALDVDDPVTRVEELAQLGGFGRLRQFGVRRRIFHRSPPTRRLVPALARTRGTRAWTTSFACSSRCGEPGSVQSRRLSVTCVSEELDRLGTRLADTTTRSCRRRPDILDPLSAGKGSRSLRRRQQKLPICREFLESTTRPHFLQMCRKKPRDVAVRRAYRRCVRNVSACSTDRQQ